MDTEILTLLDTVLSWQLELRIVLSVGYTLDTLIKVVLCWVALLGFPAFWISSVHFQWSTL